MNKRLMHAVFLGDKQVTAWTADKGKALSKFKRAHNISHSNKNSREIKAKLSKLGAMVVSKYFLEPDALKTERTPEAVHQH